MGRRKQQRLDSAVAVIQKRYGIKALHQGEPVTALPHIPTGFPLLDKLLRIGGIPRQRITEILGIPTSGAATIALKIIANAQAEGDRAAYIDLNATAGPGSSMLNPDYAFRCGVDLSKLYLAQPQTGCEALEIAQALVASREVGVLVFDSVSDLLTRSQSLQALSATLRQMASLLAKSPCAFIFLAFLDTTTDLKNTTYPGGTALAHYATVRLFIEKERWLRRSRSRDIRGYRAQVRVLKNKLGPEDKTTAISIKFNGTVQGDGT